MPPHVLRSSCCHGLAALGLLALATACDEAPSASRRDGGRDAGDARIAAPDADSAAALGPCVGEGAPGRFSEQSVVSDGEQRSYFLFVPSSYDCRRPTPLLVHFHGTVARRASEAESARPEEEWSLEAMLAVAEARGFVVVRPRARPRDFAGLVVWQWGAEGDLPRNVAFTHALLQQLGQRYNLAPERRYASGFSNGTNMALRFLADDEAGFAGYGLVGGGIWGDPPEMPELDAAAPRIYAVTGYRDYQHDTLLALLDELDAHGYPRERLLQRRVDAGHEIYGWHVAELWDWLHRGERPGPGQLTAGWTREAAPSTEQDLLAIAAAPDGALLISGAGGAIYRGQGASWQRSAQLTVGALAPALTDLCLLPSGAGLAVGQEGFVAHTGDGGRSWAAAPQLPDSFGTEGAGFGYAYLNGVACAAGPVLVGGGYWAGVQSTDAAAFGPLAFTRDTGEPALVAAVGVADSGTVIGAGYPGFVGRGTLAAGVTQRELPVTVGWLNDVAHAAGAWWVVGEAGTILRSDDDGRSWQRQPTPTREDLYAAHFWDGAVGLAVGAHGAALLTEDGGASWRDVSTGLDAFLGDVRWLDANSALVVGEAGAVLTFHR